MYTKRITRQIYAVNPGELVQEWLLRGRPVRVDVNDRAEFTGTRVQILDLVG